MAGDARMIKLDHLALGVRDWQASRDWYRTVLGLRTEFERPDVGTVALRDDGGFTLFLTELGAQPPPGACVLYFQLDDVEEAHRVLAARGVAFVHPPGKTAWGYGAELTDPDGNGVRLWDARTMRDKGGR
jgi:predicted enzyme related to lactoylglutathione lyase